MAVSGSLCQFLDRQVIDGLATCRRERLRNGRPIGTELINRTSDRERLVHREFLARFGPTEASICISNHENRDARDERHGDDVAD